MRAIVDGIERIDFGIPERESLVVSGRQDHVFHAGLFSQFCPLAATAFFRQEPVGILFIFVLVYAFHRHDPFMSADG